MTEIYFPDHLPAVVIGVPEARGDLAGAFPWAHRIHHQHGGYACLQSELYGFLLPLAEVEACSKLAQGFEALSLDSRRHDAFESFPELSAHHLSAGAPYSAAALRDFERFLGRGDFAFPSLTGGTEALLEFSGGAMAAFLGWPVLMSRGGAASAAEDAAEGERLYLDPGTVLDGASLERLRAVTGREVRAYLLWHNSD